MPEESRAKTQMSQRLAEAVDDRVGVTRRLSGLIDESTLASLLAEVDEPGLRAKVLHLASAEAHGLQAG